MREKQQTSDILCLHTGRGRASSAGPEKQWGWSVPCWCAVRQAAIAAAGHRAHCGQPGEAFCTGAEQLAQRRAGSDKPTFHLCFPSVFRSCETCCIHFLTCLPDTQGVRDIYSAEGTPMEAKAPLAVLVNKGTASASEVSMDRYLLNSHTYMDMQAYKFLSHARPSSTQVLTHKQGLECTCTKTQTQRRCWQVL